MKNKIKNNRVFRMLMLISAICVVTMLVLVYIYFFSTDSGNKYGDRLKGIEEVKMTDTKLKDVEKKLLEEKNIETAKVRVQGKIIIITLYLATDALPADGVNASTKVLENFSDEEKAFYDFQFIVTKEELASDEVFPIMGYKNSSSTGISWTNYAL